MSKVGYRSVLRQKEFVKIIIANIINRFGDSIDSIAFAWMVYMLTGSAAWSAVIYGVNKVPTIFLQPIVGAHVEKQNKKFIMVLTDLIRGACVFFVAAMFFFDLLKPWMLIITSLIISSAEAFRLPASSAILVRVLEKETIDFGVSLNSSVSSVVELIGTALAGVIVSAAGVAAAIALDALTFLASAIVILTMRNEEKIKSDVADRQSYTELLKDGCKYVLSERRILNFIILAVFANAMFVPMNSLQAPLVSEVLKADERMLSVLSLALSAGMLLASMVFPFVKERITEKSIVFGGGTSFGIYYLFLVVTGEYVNVIWVKYVLVLMGSFLAGFLVSLLSTYISATFLKVVNAEYIARAAAIMNSVGTCAVPVVSFIVSLSTTVLITRDIFIIVGVLFVVVMIFMTKMIFNDEKKGVHKENV